MIKLYSNREIISLCSGIGWYLFKLLMETSISRHIVRAMNSINCVGHTVYARTIIVAYKIYPEVLLKWHSNLNPTIDLPINNWIFCLHKMKVSAKIINIDIQSVL